jgi:hypothetical protein
VILSILPGLRDRLDLKGLRDPRGRLVQKDLRDRKGRKDRRVLQGLKVPRGRRGMTGVMMTGVILVMNQKILMKQ